MARGLMSIVGAGLLAWLMFRVWFSLSVWLAATFAIETSVAVLVVALVLSGGVVFLRRIVRQRL